jgi:hypothetical protein
MLCHKSVWEQFLQNNVSLQHTVQYCVVVIRPTSYFESNWLSSSCNPVILMKVYSVPVTIKTYFTTSSKIKLLTHGSPFIASLPHPKLMFYIINILFQWKEDSNFSVIFHPLKIYLCLVFISTAPTKNLKVGDSLLIFKHQK